MVTPCYGLKLIVVLAVEYLVGPSLDSQLA